MKVLNQEAIRRMINGGASSVVAVSGGGGGGGGLSPAWVEENYVSKAFFSQLFTIHGTKTVTDPDTGITTEEDVEITPNQLIDDEYDVTDVEVRFGLWTQQFLSALGKSSIGGGGGDTLTEPLASINNAGLGTPTAAGQAIVWNGSRWTFGTTGGGTDLDAVWDALADSTSEQINATHLSNALNGYATQNWVNSQGFLKSESYLGTVTRVATGTGLTGGPITSSGTISINSTYQTYIAHGQTAYEWGNHANVGYFKRLQNPLNINFEDKNNLNGIMYINKDAQGGNTVGFWADFGSVLNLSNDTASWQLGVDSGHALKFRSRWWSAGGREWTDWKTIPMVTGTTLKVWGQTYCSNGQLRDVTGNILMDNNTQVRMRVGSGNYDISCMTLDSGNNFILGEQVDIQNFYTFIRGRNITFQSVKDGVRSWVAVITNDGYLNIPGGINGPRHIELNSQSNAWVTPITDNGGYIDFHYGGTAQDFSTRIIEDGWGVLSVNSMNNSGAKSPSALRVGNGYNGSYIQIGNIRLIYNSTYNAIQVQKADGSAANFYATGGVSALGFTAPQSSLESFRIDYLTSTNISTQTVDVATQLNLGSSNCYIQANTNGSLTINAPAGLTLVTNSGYGLRASRFYLDATRYLYVNGSTLYYYNGQTSKAIAS